MRQKANHKLNGECCGNCKHYFAGGRNVGWSMCRCYSVGENGNWKRVNTNTPACEHYIPEHL